MKQQTQVNKIEWKEVTLGEITECLDGKRIPITESDRIIGNIPYYGANGQVGWIDKFIFNEELLLIAEDGGNWGRGQKCSYIINGKSWINNHAHVMRINQDKTQIKFLMYWLNSTDLNKHISGTTRGKLNQKIMNKIKIPLPFSNGSPDLKEQERTVSILEKAEKVKERGKKVNELLDEYLKSLFNEMFYRKGFEEKAIRELCNVISGSTPSTSKEEYWNGDIDWVTPAELEDGGNYYYFESKRKITEIGLQSISGRLFPKGTVMLTTRAPIGKVAIAGKQLCTNQGFKNMVCKNELNPVYLYYWLLLNKTYLNSLGVGATFKEISKKIVENIRVPLPPLHLQQTFASIVEHVEKLKENVRKSRERSEELFSSLMHKAFVREL